MEVLQQNSKHVNRILRFSHFGKRIGSFPKNSVPLFWSLKITLSTSKIFLKLYLLVVLCRKKLKSTFSDLLLRTTNKSGRFSAKAFLVRGTAMKRHACSYTVALNLYQQTRVYPERFCFMISTWVCLRHIRYIRWVYTISVGLQKLY